MSSVRRTLGRGHGAILGDGVALVAADVSARTAEEVVRVSLVSLSGRLEALWREAAEHVADSAARPDERDRWDLASARLTDALSSLESYAAGADIGLGRRDWASRRPSPFRLPPPRLPST